MILISHRGNVSGQNIERENTRKYIQVALDLDYDVEVDVWYNKGLWLGHDLPKERVNLQFLLQKEIWCHAKDVKTLNYLLKYGVHCFSHKDDLCVLTSKGYVLVRCGNVYEETICILPEQYPFITLKMLQKCVGICSDNIESYKSMKTSTTLDINKKTLGTLIDELFTTNMKCWFAQETVMSETDPIKVTNAAKQAQSLNARRNKLIRAIDEYSGEDNTTLTSKTYA